MGILKRTLTSSLGNHAIRALLPVLERTRGDSGELVRVLTYHRIDDDKLRQHLNPRLISATPEEFKQQVECIANYLTPVSMNQLLDAVQNNRKMPPKAVLITFDDAYRCFFETAWPILKEFDIPATMFVPTAYPDSMKRFWWDRLSASLQSTVATEWINENDVAEPIRNKQDKANRLKQWMNHVKSLEHPDAMSWVDSICDTLGEHDFESPVMTWKELQQIADEGVTLAAHTQTHPLLNRVDATTVRTELSNSFRDLQDHVSCVSPITAYPGGAHDNRVTQIAKEEGFHAAFTVRRGVANVVTGNRFRLPRINIGRGTTATLLRAQCNTHPGIFRA